mmetsp:Transcript_37414/g.112953  ORF Transcript_37414/g.112953 Transcript_37414/m.112953 type:complete len:239 (+) Transcript_37414:1018-1734(+)
MDRGPEVVLRRRARAELRRTPPPQSYGDVAIGHQRYDRHPSEAVQLLDEAQLHADDADDHAHQGHAHVHAELRQQARVQGLHDHQEVGDPCAELVAEAAESGHHDGPSPERLPRDRRHGPQAAVILLLNAAHAGVAGAIAYLVVALRAQAVVLGEDGHALRQAPRAQQVKQRDEGQPRHRQSQAHGAAYLGQRQDSRAYHGLQHGEDRRADAQRLLEVRTLLVHGSVCGPRRPPSFAL